MLDSRTTESPENSNGSVDTDRSAYEEFCRRFDLGEPVLVFGGMYFSGGTITPQAAGEILKEFSGPNRNVGKGAKSKYIDDMRMGKWRLVHQGLAFNEMLQLCDGQHRLHSCVEAGVPFSTIVAFNVRSMGQIDKGKVRSFSDTCKLKGTTSPHHPHGRRLRESSCLADGRVRRATSGSGIRSCFTVKQSSLLRSTPGRKQQRSRLQLSGHGTTSQDRGWLSFANALRREWCHRMATGRRRCLSGNLIGTRSTATKRVSKCS